MADTAIRIGVLTPHEAIGPEAEFPAMAPGRVTTRVERVSNGAALIGVKADAPSPSMLRALTAPQILDEAAATLARDPVDVIGYASTSSAYAVGFDAEAAVASRLSRRVGIPVLATCASAILALGVLGLRRIALVDPPWFDAGLNLPVPKPSPRSRRGQHVVHMQASIVGDFGSAETEPWPHR